MCGPRTSPKSRLWPFAIKRLGAHALYLSCADVAGLCQITVPTDVVTPDSNRDIILVFQAFTVGVFFMLASWVLTLCVPC
jgi:hypothetical protein